MIPPLGGSNWEMGVADKRFDVAMVAIVKNEAPYIAEWIEYHGLIGVEHFYIYDNGSTDDLAKTLKPYCLQGRATLIFWPEHPGQVSAYNHAIKIFGRDCAWMALLDIDEFIHLTDSDSLPAFLSYFAADADQILLPWVHFGSSGHDEKPEGLVIENFVHRVNEPHLQPKTIVRPEAVTVAEVHHCETRSGRTINAEGQRVKERWILQQAWDGPVRVYHYFTKSRAEFMAKLARGQADGGRGKDVTAFHRFVTETFDNSLARFGTAVRSALAATAARQEGARVSSAWSAQSELAPSRQWTVAANAAIALVADGAHDPRHLDLGSSAVTESRCLSAAIISIDEFRISVQRLADTVQAWSLLTHEGTLPPGVEISLNSDIENLGRPYLAGLVACEEPSTIEFVVSGADAGQKARTSSCRLEIGAGDTMVLMILSFRTMRVRDFVLRNGGDAGVSIRSLELLSFL